VILNAAAYTAVDRAETETEACFASNAIAPGVMAEEAEKLGALLVHYSTDYVFDGEKNAPYTEADAVNPQNQYGRSKVAGEQAIQATGTRYLIFRTSWVFSPSGTNFVKTMLRLAGERDRLRVVSDQVGAPTSAAAIARATARVCRKDEIATGLYHMTAEGSVAWSGLAEEIFRQAKFERAPVVEPIGTAEYPTPAKRPKNSRLSNDKFATTFGFRLPEWREELAETLATLLPAPATKSAK
jgi:dTDP-4-dehydrorhamnose reductase